MRRDKTAVFVIHQDISRCVTPPDDPIFRNHIFSKTTEFVTRRAALLDRCLELSVDMSFLTSAGS